MYKKDMPPIDTHVRTDVRINELCLRHRKLNENPERNVSWKHYISYKTGLHHCYPFTYQAYYDS